MKRYIKAAEGLILDVTDNYTIASQIALNNKAEWDAIEGYQKLIPFFQAKGDVDAISKIEEIISDELNHAEVLRGLMKKYDGGIETNAT